MKILNAEIKGGQVFVDGALVSGAGLLCEGKTASKGYLLIEADKFFYAAKTTQNLTAALDILSGLIAKLTADILPANQGGPITAPAFNADLTQIKQQIEKLKATQI